MDEILLSARGVSKAFYEEQALKNVDLDIYKGEAHAICGENGAGKSTLMNILSGNLTPDEGEIVYLGNEITNLDPRQAQELGISIVHQELSLCPHITVAENIFIGREPLNSRVFIKKEQLFSDAKNVLDELNFDVDPYALVADLSISQRQMVEIAKAISFDCKILILDEPTSVLTDQEVGNLFNNLEKLKKMGIGILYISHRLNEIFKLCERYVILREGRYIEKGKVCDISKDELISKIIGRVLKNVYPTKGSNTREEILRVENLSDNRKFKNISFSINKKEILGVFGLLGAGRTEVCRAISGIDPIKSGSLKLYGKSIRIGDVAESIDNGIVYITEDRKNLGLFLDQSIKSNAIVIDFSKANSRSMIKKDLEYKISKKFVEDMNTEYTDIDEKIASLSGGNQQKVLLAKWLAIKPKVMLLDEPTRGVDVGAKFEIHSKLRELAEDGVGVLVVSSELPEILGICDRIIVMNKGRLVGELISSEANEENVMMYALGRNIQEKYQNN